MYGTAYLLTKPTLDHCTHLRSRLIKSIYQSLLTSYTMFLFCGICAYYVVFLLDFGFYRAAISAVNAALLSCHFSA